MKKVAFLPVLLCFLSFSICSWNWSAAQTILVDSTYPINQELRICEGESDTLQVYLASDSNMTFLWAGRPDSTSNWSSLGPTSFPPSPYLPIITTALASPNGWQFACFMEDTVLRVKDSVLFNLVVFPEIKAFPNTMAPSCQGGNNGEIRVDSVQNAIPPLNYLWSSGDTTSTINNLSAGVYVLTITDSNGCTAIDSITLNNPPPLAIAIAGQVPLCQGDSNGIALLSSVQNGSTPLSMSWSNGSANDTIYNLPTGSYYLTLTDGNNCMATDSIALTAPPALVLTLATQNPSCHGDSSGSIWLDTIQNATEPYSYAWTNNTSIDSIHHLPVGTYSLTLTDSNNCSASATAILTDPPALSIGSATMSTPVCHGDSNASITVSVNGGSPAYSYQWNSPLASGASPNNLPQGTYVLAVLDSQGCTLDSQFVIPPTPQLNVEVMGQDTFCPGLSSNLSTPFDSFLTYAWNTGTNASFIQVFSPGTYAVTATDSLGCSHADSMAVFHWALPPLAALPDTCLWTAQAPLSLSASPGFASYQWSNGGNNSTLILFQEGLYGLTVTDDNNCQQDTFANLNLLPLPGLMGPQPATFCGNQQGIEFSIQNPQPWSYQWSTPSTLAQLTPDPGFNSTGLSPIPQSSQTDGWIYLNTNPLGTSCPARMDSLPYTILAENSPPSTTIDHNPFGNVLISGDTTNVQYQWGYLEPGGTMVTSPQDTFPVWALGNSFQANQTYFVVVSSENSCASTVNYFTLVNQMASQLTAPGLLAFPTPGDEEVFLQPLNWQGKAATLGIYNGAGQLLERRFFPLSNSNSPVPVRTDHLPSGTYHFVLQSKDQQIGKTILIQH